MSDRTSLQLVVNKPARGRKRSAAGRPASGFAPSPGPLTPELEAIIDFLAEQAAIEHHMAELTSTAAP